MDRSFDVCWDRVEPGAWTTKDEDAVSNHKSVLYVLGPRMTADNAVTVSAAALLLVDAAIKAGAVAATKGESAGVAHGLARWRDLIEQGRAALKSGDDAALSRVCRRAFAKPGRYRRKNTSKASVFILSACPRSMSRKLTAASARPSP